MLLFLPERCDTTNRQQSDKAAFIRLCEEHLSVKPSLSQKGCKRLGKLTDGSHQPRRLLVHLTSEENVSHIFSQLQRVCAAATTHTLPNQSTLTQTCRRRKPSWHSRSERRGELKRSKHRKLRLQIEVPLGEQRQLR